MKTLTLDIETSPILAHSWGLWNQNIGKNQIVQDSRVIMVGAKWDGTRKVECYHEGELDHAQVINYTHGLMAEADMVVTYNGDKFDLPRLNLEFALQGLHPLQVKSVDLIKVAKKQFRLTSNSLDFITRKFGLSQKMQHSGHEMWMNALEGAGDTRDKAWREMTKYCKQDVKITEELLHFLGPWVHSLPNANLYDDKKFPENGCANPFCDGTAADLVWQGYRTTRTARYPRYQCNLCGTWGSIGKNDRTAVNR